MDTVVPEWDLPGINLPPPPPLLTPHGFKQPHSHSFNAELEIIYGSVAALRI
jgi:hypothetical protein